MAFQIICHADNGAFGNIGMAGQHLFHSAGRQAVAGNVDDIISAGHDVKIAVGIHISGIAGFVISGEMRQIAFVKAVIGVPQGWQAAGWQRQFDGDGPQGAGADLIASFIEDLHIIAGHGHGRAADFHGQCAKTKRVCGDGVAGFGLPPMVNDRHFHVPLCPVDGIGVCAFTRKEHGLQMRQIEFAGKVTLRVFTLDGAQGRGCGEKGMHLVFRHHAPEGRGIGRAHGLAFKHQGGATRNQGAVADIAVAHDPAHIGRCPEHGTGRAVIDGLHRPLQGHQMAGSGADHALWRAGGARGIEDIGGVVAGQGDAICRGNAGLGCVPVKVMRAHICHQLRALQDDAAGGFVGSHGDGLIQQGFIGHNARRFDPATGCDHDLGHAIINPHGQFSGRKATEYDRMNGPDTRAGQHGHHGLGHHGHIDQHAVASNHALGQKRACQLCRAGLQIGIGDVGLRGRDRAVMDNGDAVTVACQHVAIHGIVTAVDLCIGEPFIQRRLCGIERAGGGHCPINGAGGAQVKCFGIGLRGSVSCSICHKRPPSIWPQFAWPMM